MKLSMGAHESLRKLSSEFCNGMKNDLTVFTGISYRPKIIFDVICSVANITEIELRWNAL